jgi:transcriptional regulator NrdR family protein|tara:strand:- start:1113 stop:1541 length:429 start_codon:yes stop_codon:yes gene_type:complete
MKCPKCGEEIEAIPMTVSDSYRSPRRQRDLDKLMMKMDKSLRKLVRKVINDIQNNIPSEQLGKGVMPFLKAITSVDKEVAKWAINSYYKGKYVYQGKGFAYLKYIINSHSMNRERLLKNERKTYGSLPKPKTIKEKEDGESI